MAKFPKKKIRGQEYELAHLDDMTIKVNEGEDSVIVLITFGCHCFTEKFDASRHTPDLAYHHRGEKRAFCKIRYALSLSLPGYITGLLGKSVYLTQRGSYFIIRSNGGNYVVFLNVRRRNGKPHNACVSVESAHIRQQFIQYASPVRFTALVAAKARGHEIKGGPNVRIKRS